MCSMEVDLETEKDGCRPRITVVTTQGLEFKPLSHNNMFTNKMFLSKNVGKKVESTLRVVQSETELLHKLIGRYDSRSLIYSDRLIKRAAESNLCAGCGLRVANNTAREETG